MLLLHRYYLSDGVMVALQILALSVWVRILVGQLELTRGVMATRKALSLKFLVRILASQQKKRLRPLFYFILFPSFLSFSNSFCISFNEDSLSSISLERFSISFSFF